MLRAKRDTLNARKRLMYVLTARNGVGRGGLGCCSSAFRLAMTVQCIVRGKYTYPDPVCQEMFSHENVCPVCAGSPSPYYKPPTPAKTPASSYQGWTTSSHPASGSPSYPSGNHRP